MIKFRIRTQKQPKFIVYAFPFDERSGGALALHTLCDRLSQLGFCAVVWPNLKPRSRNVFKWSILRNHIAYLLSIVRGFSTGPFCNSVAKYADLKKGIVVYPEVISGNPLNGDVVARWFLHRPGYHSGDINYGKNDLFFFFNPSFNDASINPDLSRLLSVLYVNPAYRRTNFGPRSGSCYIIRKGRERRLNRHPSDAILIDDMSHEEISHIFNQVEYLYSYDLYTMYTHYAALCGCVPIIIPQRGVKLEQWESAPEARYGRAYGSDQIDWAVATQERLRELFSKQRAGEDAQVRRFAEICLERLDSGHGSNSGCAINA